MPAAFITSRTALAGRLQREDLRLLVRNSKDLLLLVTNTKHVGCQLVPGLGATELAQD